MQHEEAHMHLQVYARIAAGTVIATLLLRLAAADELPLAMRLAEPIRVDAVVLKVIDGDTLGVDVPAWAGTPFHEWSVRIAEIDTPEKARPPAKCRSEVALGQAASAFAKTLLKAGDRVVLVYTGHDKYFRLDGRVILPDGRDFAATMIAAGCAAPYDGGKKRSWCQRGLQPCQTP
jgi:endonuclease YncB( thermonuclease family)